jgi:hypothetical protein
VAARVVFDCSVVRVTCVSLAAPVAQHQLSREHHPATLIQIV